MNLLFWMTLLVASADTEPMVLFCKAPGQNGLFEQCQEVVVLEEMGSRLRVYSRPQKLVLTVERSQTFYARSLLKNENLKKEQTLTIPSTFLWNSSKVGYQSICTLGSPLAAKSRMLRVTCGNQKEETILRELVYLLKPYRTQAAGTPRI